MVGNAMGRDQTLTAFTTASTPAALVVGIGCLAGGNPKAVVALMLKCSLGQGCAWDGARTRLVAIRRRIGSNETEDEMGGCKVRL